MKPNKLEVKLKIEKLFKETLWQYVIIIAILCLLGWLFDKPIETVMFCVAHIVIRKQFDKQYHCNTTAKCLSLTLTIALFGIAVCLPLSISLLSAIPLCFIIAAVGYVVQDRLDTVADLRMARIETDKLTATLKEYQHPDIYKMTEDELRQYGTSKQLSELQQDILVFRIKDHLLISEICEYKNYGRTTIKYHIAEIKKKLNIENI